MRWVEFGKDYAPFMKLEFAEGKNMDAPGQILVNETFLKMMHWEDKPIGRQVRNGDRIAGNIVGTERLCHIQCRLCGGATYVCNLS